MTRPATRLETPTPADYLWAEDEVRRALIRADMLGVIVTVTRAPRDRLNPAMGDEVYVIETKPARRELSLANRTLKCACCGTTKNLHRDNGSGGPYRCDSLDCMVF